MREKKIHLTIKKFTYTDETKKVSTLVKEEYSMITLKFNSETKELTLSCREKFSEKLKVVFNMLTIINRFDLK